MTALAFQLDRTLAWSTAAIHVQSAVARFSVMWADSLLWFAAAQGPAENGYNKTITVTKLCEISVQLELEVLALHPNSE